MSQQGKRQASFRTVGATALNYEGDALACFAVHGVTTGTFNERFLSWINSRLSTAYTSLPEAQQRYVIARTSVIQPIPAFSTTAATYTNVTLPGRHSVVVPAHNAGDVLVCLVLCRNVEVNGTVTSFTFGWTQFGGAGNMYGGAQVGRLAAAWKIGDGVESQIQFDATGGTTTDLVVAQVYRFTASGGFASPPLANIGTATSGSGVTITMPNVTTSANNQLAVALLVVGLNTSIASSTGESGGDWVAFDVAVGDGTNGTMRCQSAGIATAGTISGGTVTITSATWVGIGFSLIPATQNDLNWCSMGTFTP